MRRQATQTFWEDAEHQARNRPWGLGASCGFAASNNGAGYGCPVGLTYRIRLFWEDLRLPETFFN